MTKLEEAARVYALALRACEDLNNRHRELVDQQRRIESELDAIESGQTQQHAAKRAAWEALLELTKLYAEDS